MPGGSCSPQQGVHVPPKQVHVPPGTLEDLKESKMTKYLGCFYQLQGGEGPPTHFFPFDACWSHRPWWSLCDRKSQLRERAIQPILQIGHFIPLQTYRVSNWPCCPKITLRTRQRIGSKGQPRATRLFQAQKCSLETSRL